VCYRWHVLDAVGFTKSLKVAIEHKGNRAEDTEGFYLERPDFINSVAFWYQVGEPKRFGRCPCILSDPSPAKSSARAGISAGESQRRDQSASRD
jgi:hypothetical protein